VEVEIWSDVNCPWCYVGKRRFETALARFAHAHAVNVTWRSFELDPHAPPEVPGSAAAALADKYGVALDRARAMEQSVGRVASEEGIVCDLEHARTGSSFDAHRLLQLARRRGVADAMKERLFAARFSEGRLLSDLETLVKLAIDVGLDGTEVRTVLAGDDYANEVREDEATARQLGIRAVPTFVVDRALGMSGAQPADELLALLEHAWETHGGVDPPRTDAA
jgi:predicted DsbA family dithiol-disulfide isomerase